LVADIIDVVVAFAVIAAVTWSVYFVG